LDPQPDIDLLMESQIQAQLEARAGKEQGLSDDEPVSADSSTGSAPRPAESTTLQEFFGKMGTAPVASEANGKKHPTQVARENFERALADLHEVQHTDKGKDGPRHRYLPIVAPVALVAIIVGILTLLPQAPAPLSPHLIGTWETSAGKYADRTLRISESEIAFEQGSREGFASYPVTGVTSERNTGGALSYVITYDNAGMAHRFSFTHQPVANTITLKNQPQVVWQKSRN
jgi:hypothetical protein